MFLPGATDPQLHLIPYFYHFVKLKHVLKWFNFPLNNRHLTEVTYITYYHLFIFRIFQEMCAITFLPPEYEISSPTFCGMIFFSLGRRKRDNERELFPSIFLPEKRKKEVPALKPSHAHATKRDVINELQLLLSFYTLYINQRNNRVFYT